MLKRSEKEIVFFIVSNLILWVFAFGFLFNEINFVDGLYGSYTGRPNIQGGPDKITAMQNAEATKQTTLSSVQNPTGSKEMGSWLSNKFSFGGGAGSFGDALVSGAEWAAIAYLAGQLIGPMIGLDKDNTKALSTALAAGFGIGKFASVANFIGGTGTNVFYTSGADFSSAFFGQAGILGLGPVGIGIVVAIIVFVVMYKDTKTETITFACSPWQAPLGGKDCEKCNDDRLPCSEYRCKSLGQACELLNPGSAEEKCVWVNPNDVKPPQIYPSETELSEGYEYSEVKNFPPGPGFKIIGKEQECVKAFTPLKFGIDTDEPSRCKIDYNHTEKLENMNYWFGSSSLYKYNHTEQFSLPGPANLKAENLTIVNDGKWTFFIRCMDKNGNENSAEYAVRFCVDASPDNTAPVVAATSILNEGCIAENENSEEVEFYTNEPAECRWSKIEEAFNSMDSGMECSNRIYEMNALQLYTCKTELTGIGRRDTSFFIRCRDQPLKSKDDNESRNDMASSFEFKLRGTTGLKMRNLKPNETVYGSINPAPVILSAETLLGCKEGKALCYYSDVDNDADYVQFFETGESVHTQKLYLSEGDKIYYIKCVDDGGNVVKDSINFNVNIDTSASAIARVYKEDDRLKIITTRNSECVYINNDDEGCDFIFDEGTQMPVKNSKEHVAEWYEDKTYYIKCRDEVNPETADCSMIVRPSRF